MHVIKLITKIGMNASSIFSRPSPRNVRSFTIFGHLYYFVRLLNYNQEISYHLDKICRKDAITSELRFFIIKKILGNKNE